MKKCPFFVATDFLRNELDNLPSNYAWKKACFPSIEWCQDYCVFCELELFLAVLPAAAVLGLFSVGTNAYDVGMLWSWYHSIAINCALSHVKFGGGLAIPFLSNRALIYKNKMEETEKLLKNHHNYKTPPSYTQNPYCTQNYSQALTPSLTISTQGISTCASLKENLTAVTRV